MSRAAMAALVIWAIALVAGALITDVSPIRAGMATLVGLALLAPIRRDDVRIGLCATFGGLLVAPGLAEPWPWIPLVIAAVLVDRRDFRMRVGSALAGAAIAMVIFPFLENTTVGEILRVGIGCSFVGLGAPTKPVAGAPLAMIAGFAAAQGYQLGVDARTLPIEKIAPIVASRGAERLRPLLAARAGKSLREGDDSDAVHVIRAFPSAHILGQNLAKSRGVSVVIDLGWLPDQPVDSSIAVEVAWALQDSGHHSEALAVLGPEPQMAFHRAILQAEQGGERWLPPVLPDGILVAPGILIERAEILHNEDIQVFFAAREAMSKIILEATGETFLGPPELSVSVAGEEIGRVQVEDDGGTWTFERQMPRGVYRLVLSYANDHHNDNGDRNLYGVRVTVE